MEVDSKQIDEIRLYKPKLAARIGGRPLRVYHVVFWALIFVNLGWSLSTIGQPYVEFLEKADREGFDVMQGQTKMKAELEHALGDLNDPSRPTKKLGWFDWMDMDLGEHAARKKREKQQSVLDSLPKHMRVPNKYAPSFVPTLVCGVVICLYFLVLLLQHWSVGFHVWINFVEVQEPAELPEEWYELPDEDSGAAGAPPIPTNFPTHARIAPAKGKHLLVELEWIPTLGITLMYHRRRYVWNEEAQLWTKIRCRTNLPLEFLKDWQGFSSIEEQRSSKLRYGTNEFSVTQPSFRELYKKQLLSPFTVFQLFCVVLWMLDDYWQYSFFTLAMILTFEATVVFQRIKSLQALRGMGNATRQVNVFRFGKWSPISSTELLPGDIVSLHRVKPKYTDDKKSKVQDEGGDIVPADLLLLNGATVVNEASLTGESVPQMKEGLVLDTSVGADELAIKTTHKAQTLYAGTKMLQCKSAQEGGEIPVPPDGGSIAFVLRTGFASAQGKLVRMMEGSQEKVKGHERETGLLLLLLFFFAIASSGYVLYHGLQSDKRSHYELLLHCILIITSVIPPELPMQMALAVNNSLMTLMKLHIFCTEPFRVPMAGKLDACLFDKTGTLTTDELVAVGVLLPGQLSSANDTKKATTTTTTSQLTPMTQISTGAGLVLAGCHSLVEVEGETTGDPLELAALTSMRWMLSNERMVPAPATAKKEAGNLLKVGDRSLAFVVVKTRHHFSSKLQRMSCVVSSTGGLNYAVAKGSPEAIGRLLRTKPSGYDTKAKALAKEGYRVIALAYKPLAEDKAILAAKDSRAACEADLEFAGFIAFTCRVRKDTANVLKRLKEGGMSIAMVTGDAILTAIHVAKEIQICDPISGDTVVDSEDPYALEKNAELKALLDTKRGVVTKKKDTKDAAPTIQFKPILTLETGNSKRSLCWKSYDDESTVESFVAAKIPELAKTYDLATTGRSLELAYELDPDMKTVLGHIKVFARMAPDMKETVIDCLHGVGTMCLMCGDGANDVGALKQADVGVALLSGFGDINVDRGEDDTKKTEKKDDGARAIMSAEHLQQIRQLPVTMLKMRIRQLGCDPNKYPHLKEKEDLVQLYQIKAREAAVKRHDEKKTKKSRAEIQAEKREQAKIQQEKMLKRMQELEAKGEKWAMVKAAREVMAEQAAEIRKKKGIVGSGVEGQAASLVAQFEEMESGDLPMVKLGDASIAAPFTSKMPSIRSCVDIVRQGRCTLVSSMQMYQILALNCLISSYSLSVLYLDGIKYGDTQMTAMGMLGSISFMSVSRSKPLDRLSSVRPLTSIFHPSMFFSLLGQFSIHLVTMILATREAKRLMGDDFEVDLDGQFQPGLLNTVVFLVNNVQSVTVFVVNLQGRPFMTGLTENRPLLWSLLATFILTFMFASESVPKLNKYFQLVPFPDPEFRDYLLKLLALDVAGAFILDRLLKFIFAPQILIASVKDTTWKDVFKLLRTMGIAVFLMISFLGNDDMWEEMMLQEERMLNESLKENATLMECVGEACEAAATMVMNATVGDGAADEF